jgi:hypothetical protein
MIWMRALVSAELALPAGSVALVDVESGSPTLLAQPEAATDIERTTRDTGTIERVMAAPS